MSFQKRMISGLLAAALLLPCLGLEASAAGKILHGIGYVTMADQCLYAKASASSDVLDVTQEHDCVIINKANGKNWYSVSYNGQEGFMFAGCLDVQTEANVELGIGRISSNEANLRSAASLEYTVLDTVKQDEEFPVIGLYDGFFKILLDNKTRYVRSDLMELTEIPYQNQASEKLPSFYYLGEIIGEITFDEVEAELIPEPEPLIDPVPSPNPTGTLLSNALSLLGTPYVYGGWSPSGVDCSGLVFYSMLKAGRNCARTAAGQYAMGYYVDRGELIPGDLVFFSSSPGGGVTHVGIYTGGNSFVHAPNSDGVVCYASITGHWDKNFVGARRVW